MSAPSQQWAAVRTYSLARNEKLIPYNPQNSMTSITTWPQIQGEKMALKFMLNLHEY